MEDIMKMIAQSGPAVLMAVVFFYFLSGEKKSSSEANNAAKKELAEWLTGEFKELQSGANAAILQAVSNNREIADNFAKESHEQQDEIKTLLREALKVTGQVVKTVDSHGRTLEGYSRMMESLKTAIDQMKVELARKADKDEK